MIDFLNERLQRFSALKWYATVTVRMIQDAEERMETNAHFVSSTVRIARGDDLSDLIEDLIWEIFRQIDEFESNGSGWQFEEILEIRVCTICYEPLGGGTFIPTPSKLRNTRSIINVQNNDDKCLVWSILAHLFPVENNVSKVWPYTPHEEALNMQNISFPTPVKELARVELQNDLSINVFTYEGRKVLPHRLSKSIKERHVNLMLLKAGERQHYCLIKNFSGLMSSTSKNTRARFFCYNCLHGFTREDLLVTHKEICAKKKAQKVLLPEKESEKTIQFKNIAKQLRAPFIIYADFECFTKPIDTCDANPNRASTTRYQEHEVCGACYYIVSSDETKKIFTKAETRWRRYEMVF